MKTIEEINIQKEKRKIYMREYKRREYKEKHDEMKEIQRLYYHNNKNKESTNPNIEFVKVLSHLNRIKTIKPDELKTFMTDYINTL
jgi:hypothetical protein